MTLDKDWVLVPREPTEAMWKAHWKAVGLTPAEFRAWWSVPSMRDGANPHSSAAVREWSAMLAAAPPPVITDEMVERGARAITLARGVNLPGTDIDARACLEAALRPGGGE